MRRDISMPSFIFGPLNQAVTFVSLQSILNLSRADLPSHCADCQLFFCCSSTCADARATMHRIECGALRHAAKIAQQTDVEIDMIRLLIRLVSRIVSEYQCDDTAHADSAAACDSQPTLFRDAWSLLSNAHSAAPEWMRVITAAAKALVAQLDADTLVTLAVALDDVSSGNCDEEMTRNSRRTKSRAVHASNLDQARKSTADLLLGLSLRINANSHSLGGGDSGDPNMANASAANVAFGLFPTTARINHSCAPNAHFTGTVGAVMSVRTTRPLAAGEELTVRYVDIYAPRESRQHELMQTKAFLCSCPRCSVPINQSVDRFLTGMLCPNAACRQRVPDNLMRISECGHPLFASLDVSQGGHALSPQSHAAAPAANEAALAAAMAAALLLEEEEESASSKGNNKQSKKNKKKAHQAAAVASSAAASGALAPHRLEWVCLACSHRSPVTTVEGGVRAMQAELDAALRARSRSGLARARELLEAFVTRYDGVLLHRAHICVVNALIPLMNVCTAQGDWAAAIKYTRRVIAAFDVVYPRIYGETADFLFAAAEAMTRLIDASSSASESEKAAASPAVAQFEKERAEFMRRCYGIRQTCCGDSHSLTKATRAAAATMGVDLA